MRRTTALSALFLVVVWIASPSGQSASGQRGRLPPDTARSTTKLPARWWKDPTIARAVGLSAFQAERIDTLFDEFLKPQRERWTALRSLEKQLEELLRQPNPDEKLVLDRITVVENRRSEMNRNRLIMLFHIERVLSPSQRSKLQDLARSPFPATGPRKPRHRVERLLAPPLTLPSDAVRAQCPFLFDCTRRSAHTRAVLEPGALRCARRGSRHPDRARQAPAQGSDLPSRRLRYRVYLRARGKERRRGQVAAGIRRVGLPPIRGICATRT